MLLLLLLQLYHVIDGWNLITNSGKGDISVTVDDINIWTNDWTSVSVITCHLLTIACVYLFKWIEWDEN